MSPNNSQGISIARPSIHLAAQNNPALSDGLLGLSIVENTAGLYRCEAMFGNWGLNNGDIDFVYFDRRTLEFGRPFKIKFDDVAIFDGRIMALEALFPQDLAPSIAVLAEDRFQDLRMIRRTRTFADASDADVMRQIASDHGLTPNIDLPDSQHRILAQVNQSDLAFLRERARALDAELWVDGSALYAKRHSSRGQQTLQLTYQQGLKEFSVLADLAAQRTSVTVNGWDVGSKQAITHEATALVIQGELNGDTSGVSIVQQALGARKEALVHTVPLTSTEAQAQAEAFFKLSARQFVVGRGTAETSAQLRVGAYVDLQRLGPLFSGKYYVTEVRHVFDGMGIRTEFTGERAGIGRP
jgi:phage protein D